MLVNWTSDCKNDLVSNKGYQNLLNENVFMKTKKQKVQ